ncbi:MAG: flagellar filament capping protein FliD [Fervidobacterium sp.]
MDLSSIANNINYRYQQSSRMQIGGAISGLDTQSIIEKLMEVEALPLNRLNDKYLQYTNLQKAYQKVSDKIRDFYNFLGNFSLQSNLIPKMATSSSNILSAQAASSAVDGTYNVEVLSLATNSIFTGSSFAKSISSADTISSIDTRYPPVDSTVRVKVGTTETNVNIQTTDTVADVVALLQNALNSLGASATVAYDESSGKLSITSDRAFQITNVTGNFTFLFRLSDSTLEQVGSNFVLKSSGNIGVYSQYKTLESLGVLSDGVININGKVVSLSKTDTLSSVLKKINDTVPDVRALYDDKNGRLIITSKSTGDNLINVTGDSDLMIKLGLSSGNFVLGQTAKLNISLNGYTELVEAKTNSVKYNGLTLNLSSIGTSVVTVSTDKEKIVDKVQEFVDKWNELTDFLYTKLTENKVTGKPEEQMTEDEKLKGLLKNDSLLRKIFERFKGFLSQSVDGKRLADLGIESGDSGKSFANTMRGKITLEKEKLRNFIDKNGFDAVWSFFGKTDGDNGLAIRIKDYSYQLTKFGGEIDTVAGVSGRLEREKRVLSKRMVTMMEYLQKKEQMLWAKYSNLESALAKLSAQGSYISQAFSSKK